jgi:hypothetical protein
MQQRLDQDSELETPSVKGANEVSACSEDNRKIIGKAFFLAESVALLTIQRTPQTILLHYDATPLNATLMRVPTPSVVMKQVFTPNQPPTPNDRLLHKFLDNGVRHAGCRCRSAS